MAEENVNPETTLPKGMEKAIGLAVTSLVLGIISLPLALIAVGAVTGLAGLIVGIIHLRKKLAFRATAITGLVLSAAGLTAGAAMGTLYGIGIYQTHKEMSELREEQQVEYTGTAVPDITFKGIDGNTIRLADLKGKRVLLDFWATWCPPCKKEIPHLVKLRETVSGEKLVIIGISDEPAETIKRFADAQKINYPLVSTANLKLPEPFDKILSIPTAFVIDANGVIEDIFSGYHSFEELKQSAVGRQ
jgi:peroxiredoxin